MILRLQVNTYREVTEREKKIESQRLAAATVVDVCFRHQQWFKNNANITITKRWEILELLLQLFCHGNVIFKFMKIVAGYITIVGLRWN